MLKHTLYTSALIALVSAHGQVFEVVSGGTQNAGPNIYFSGDAANSKTVTRVMYQASSPAFVLPSGYGDNSKMSCEGSANSPAPDTISVAAGSTLTVQWAGATGELDGFAGVNNRHPWVHAMGPVMDYITSCNGACNKFDATNAGWTKIQQGGIDFSQSISGDLRTRMTNKPEKYYPTSGNGLWAMAKLLQDGSQWDIKIPEGLQAGEYIVRHELAAIHNPLNSDPTTGPQHYIACVQVKVTGSGSKTLPAGTQAKSLYPSNGAFAKFNVYNDDIHSFQTPGPAIWDGVSGGGSSSGGSSSGSSSSSSSSSSGGGTANVANSPKPASSPAPQGNSNSNSTPAPPPKAAAASSPSTTGKKCKRRVNGTRRSTKRSADAAAAPLKFHRARRSFAEIH